MLSGRAQSHCSHAHLFLAPVSLTGGLHGSWTQGNEGEPPRYLFSHMMLSQMSVTLTALVILPPHSLAAGFESTPMLAV
ncbi:hypothetical protein ASPBRDRAFT_37794 [Aspergillus brasiliensis CBS 101740]|uniref:Uncharacterized protein n=1 Tax=Aspergillus brasiliensis (strain CBS 101740 / IMI 381727 / IBT 21946) TaxID=767769 RepID=A0A1L9UUV9_ASPBC|nr:hypothetical protein ASPBRDRAFT_37794 [Aspergillus brasiliensis CBS 101740]